MREVKKLVGPLRASVVVDWSVDVLMTVTVTVPVAVRMIIHMMDWHHAIICMWNVCMTIVAMGGAARMRNASNHAVIVAIAEVATRAELVAVMMSVSERAMLITVTITVMVMILVCVLIID